MSTNWTSVSSSLEQMLRHGRPAKGAPVYARPIRPYPISRYASGPGTVSARDWVAAPSPEWVAEYENASVERRHFMVMFMTPPEIPADVLSTVERHRGDWLFYAWRWEGTRAQLQWVSPSYRPPFADWQVFFAAERVGGNPASSQDRVNSGAMAVERGRCDGIVGRGGLGHMVGHHTLADR